MPELTIVFPVRNEAANLLPLHQQIVAVLQQEDYELLFVDDGSTDRTTSLLQYLTTINARVRYLSFQKSYGQEAALWTGLSYARGQAVITMDADLQHPPEVLSELLRLWRDGWKIVTTRKNGSSSWWQSDFRLLDRSVVDRLLSRPGRFLRRTIPSLGTSIAVPYTVGLRRGGRSNYTWLSLLRYVFKGFTASWRRQPDVKLRVMSWS